MVRSIVPALDGDPSVALIHCPGPVAGLNPSGHALEPTKFTAVGIVMQQGAQPRAGHSRTSSHGDLGK
jgi:hypothetical protein